MFAGSAALGRAFYQRLIALLGDIPLLAYAGLITAPGLILLATAKFVPFLDFDIEIRKIICTTNAIESINARLRRAVNARGHFPNCEYQRVLLPAAA